jgi:predicted RNA methylase
MLSRIKFELGPVVDQILNRLPEEVWTSKTTTFLDPAMAGGQFVREVERRLLAAGHSKKNVANRVFGYEQYEHQVCYAVNKYKLIGNYKVTNFLKESIDMKFDVVLMNPPYTDGQIMLYTKFFERALELGETVASVMPLDLQSKHDKLKFHNERVLKHQEFISDNISDYFNVAYDNLHYVIAKKSIENVITEIKDPLDDMPLLFVDRPRLKPIKGDTDIAMGDEVPNGVDVIFKVHKNDTIVYKKVDQYKVDKSSKKSKSPYLVIVNHTPSKGKFNCVVLPNTGLCWSMWTFAFEVKSKAEGVKLKKWLTSPTIVEEINKMLVARNNQHTISKAMIERLPTYA